METVMLFITTFLEGIISFISPCMLPMLPVYISYFAGVENTKRSRTLTRVLCFVLGFTLVFCLMGLLAGTLGAFLRKFETAVNIICGLIVILFGLSYLEVIRLPFFKGVNTVSGKAGLVSAFLFGLIFSVNLTPCIGAFLGSALLLASSSGTALKGGLLLLVYSLGLGIPFLLSALLLDRLKAAFGFIKKHYKVINIICGCFLIAVGISMMLGILGKLLGILSIGG